MFLLKSNRKTYLPFFMMTGVVTLAFAFYFDWLMYHRLMGEFEQHAGRHASAVAALVRELDHLEGPSLDARVETLSRGLEGMRITVFSGQGERLADSALAAHESGPMDLEGPNPEVQQAITYGRGLSVRTNEFMGITYLYAAVSGEGEGGRVSRVAIPLDAVEGHRAHIRAMLALGGGGTLVLALVLLSMLGRRTSLTARVQDEKDRLEALVRARTSTLTELRALGSMLGVCNGTDDAAQVAAAHVPRLLGGERGALALINPSRNLLVVQKSWGGAWPHPVHTPPVDCWALRKSAVHTSDPEEGIVCAHFDRPLEEKVTCIPLIAQGDSLGVIHVAGAGESEPAHRLHDPLGGDNTLDVARAVGEEVAVAISNLQLRETLKQQALRDSLTGLYNRRFLEEHFAYEVARARRHENPLSLLVIDVDHFKPFNDNYGHDAGDYVLSTIGKTLRDSLRGEDVVCRLGGEEFAAVLAETGQAGAVEFAEKIRAAIGGKEVHFMGKAIGTVTISVGVAVFPEHGNDLPSLLKAGDEALYAAKDGGRNRVCAAG